MICSGPRGIISNMENGHRRGSVLVVDDEPTIGEVVSRYLERAGYTTRVAADGPRALELAAAQRPDLVVLDLMLPGMDGLEVMRRLRAQSAGPERPSVILLTAKAEPTDRVIGLRLGADDYSARPSSVGSGRGRPRRARRRPGRPRRSARPRRVGSVGSRWASQASWAPGTPSSTTKDSRVRTGAPGRVTKFTTR